ncbi:MAG: ABC transporter ATP-binding protein [Gloeobacterales cyanobacterium]
MTIPAIRIQDLYKSYGSIKAVKGISLDIEPGEIFGILGPNGAGKTTTLRCLCTLEKPDRGTLTIAGVSVVDDPRRARSYLGYVAQEVAQDKILTGRELLAFQAGLYHLPRTIIPKRIEAVLEILDLTDRADDRIGGYSGGMKKRLDLACAMLHAPAVLVLDEPTVGLDIQSRRAVWEFLHAIKAQGTTVLITSHYLEEIDVLADRVAIIDRGKVIAQGTPDQLKTNLGGDRVTIRIREFTPLEEAEKASALLKVLPEVQEVGINKSQGNALYLVVQAGSMALSTLQQTVAQAGLPIFSLAQARPSLDDVFLATTGQTLTDMALADETMAEGRKAKKK